MVERRVSDEHRSMIDEAEMTFLADLSEGLDEAVGQRAASKRSFWDCR
jgi:hypothetical protein